MAKVATLFRFDVLDFRFSVFGFLFSMFDLDIFWMLSQLLEYLCCVIGAICQTAAGGGGEPRSDDALGICCHNDSQLKYHKHSLLRV